MASLALVLPAAGPAAAAEGGDPAGSAGRPGVGPAGQPPGFSVLLETDTLLLPGGGRFFAGFGGEARPGWRQDFSGLEGTLYRVGLFGFQVAFSDDISVRLDGALVERLEVNPEDSDPEPGFGTGPATDVGTPRFATVLRLAPQRGPRPAFGLVFAATIPTTDDTAGIGLDTTDVFASSVWEWQGAAGSLTGNLGVGILDSPTSLREQNDVLTYGLRGRRELGRAGRWSLMGEVNGHASTIGTTAPPGTRNRAVLRVGVSRHLARLGWELALTQGLVRRDGDLGLGFALLWGGGRRSPAP